MKQCRICLEDCDEKLLCDCIGTIGYYHNICLQYYINNKQLK